MNNFRNEVYDLYSDGKKSFNRCSSEQKMELIKLYMDSESYRYSDVLEVLINPKAVSDYFVKVSGIHESVPDDSDEIIDGMFIDFVCTHLSYPDSVFDEFFLEKIEDLADTLFDHFDSVEDRDLFWGVSARELCNG